MGLSEARQGMSSKAADMMLAMSSLLINVLPRNSAGLLAGDIGQLFAPPLCNMQYAMPRPVAVRRGLPGQVWENAPWFAQDDWLLTDKQQCLPDRAWTRGAPVLSLMMSLAAKQGCFVVVKLPNAFRRLEKSFEAGSNRPYADQIGLIRRGWPSSVV